MVTLDGVYFEGSFTADKTTGFGLMLFEDGTSYQGEFGANGEFGGKGCLTLPNGDTLDGNFQGSWTGDVKISGTFNKFFSCDRKKECEQHVEEVSDKAFGTLCVEADRKWEEVFDWCVEESLAGGADTAKAWEAVAIALCRQRKNPNGGSDQEDDLLSTIPTDLDSKLNLNNFRRIREYLMVAFEEGTRCRHPLGTLMAAVVDGFRATYSGIGAHPRLLSHAVLEVRSVVRRIYETARILFPNLPPSTAAILELCDETRPEDDNEEDGEVVTPEALLHPLLLPRIYPSLFLLYALKNETDDGLYWDRLLKWNRQSDRALMEFLGVDTKFLSSYTDSEIAVGKSEKYFCDAIENLQQVSTKFSPFEKLCVIKSTFAMINSHVRGSLGDSHVLCMDELFPLFQFVVVRASIRHLGSEIHLISDLMESHLQLGELGMMFTTLQAAFFQIKTEKFGGISDLQHSANSFH